LIKLFKSLNCDINIVFTTTKVSNYFSLKDRTPHCLKSGVVYLYRCQVDPDITYIGKTKRHLFKRVREHKDPSKRSSIQDHLLTCNCSDLFRPDKFKILHSNPCDFTLQIVEALCIKKFNPNLNRSICNNGSSYFLKLF
jgi:hypothetical protein